jgi:hypothetical protein
MGIGAMYRLRISLAGASGPRDALTEISNKVQWSETTKPALKGGSAPLG